ncbi:hypothetical protein A9Z40_03205 [Microbacterium arborescens]|uniref:Uncharacterized protein n=1 Tax=Microbacterium arborescens TaxID=33883 RepID=A0ABX2WIH0_9MICO|nr:hypothetical protein [Microbacterium arborescens]OAZ40963.1 hypothetical protein A9Z40_03205 [Microbacterium arborescens]
MTTTHDARRTALLARLSDADLLAEHGKLDARNDLTASERMTAAWLADELHARYPETTSIIDGYFEADENLTESYHVLLRRALAQVGFFAPAVGSDVRALKMTAAGTSLVPGVVTSRDVHDGSPRIVVRFADGTERSYSGQGIADYVLA